MTTTGRSRLLVLLVVILVVTNAVMLYLLLQDSKEQKKTREEKQVEFMQKELKLDNGQLDRYKALRAKRDSLLVPLNDSLRVSKFKMLDYLRQPAGAVPDSLVRQVADEISRRQKEIEVAYYYHFRRIQAICRPDQVPLFDTVLINMINRTTNKPEVKK